MGAKRKQQNRVATHKFAPHEASRSFASLGTLNLRCTCNGVAKPANLNPPGINHAEPHSLSSVMCSGDPGVSGSGRKLARLARTTW